MTTLQERLRADADEWLRGCPRNLLLAEAAFTLDAREAEIERLERNVRNQSATLATILDAGNNATLQQWGAEAKAAALAARVEVLETALEHTAKWCEAEAKESPNDFISSRWYARLSVIRDAISNTISSEALTQEAKDAQ